MAFILSVSSRTVLSVPEKLHELFLWHTQAIEIGNLVNDSDFDYMVEKCNRLAISLGLHTPVYASDEGSSLLWEDTKAWDELRRNLEAAIAKGIVYVVVHFPYVWDRLHRNLGIDCFRAAIPKIKELESWAGVPVVCEPQLGPNRDPTAFTILWSIGHQELQQWGLSLALDLGDIYLACRRLRVEWKPLLTHLAPWCRVAYIHHVWGGGRHYYWMPVASQGNVPIEPMLGCLGALAEHDIYAVLEHHPHRSGSVEQIGKGINWLLQHVGPWKGRGDNLTWDGKYRAVR